MKNPRLYFTLESNIVLRPALRLVPDLDTMYSEIKFLKECAVVYNKYTKNFIDSIKGSDDLFYSEDYEYSAKTHMFNFNHVQLCEDDDYMDLSRALAEKSCQFDYKTDYTFDGIKELKRNEPTAKTVEQAKPQPVVKKPQATLKMLDHIKEQYPCPTVSDSGFYVDPRNWNFLVRNIMKHVNTILIGPTGTGKTEIIMRICQMMGIDCNVYDMGSMQDPLTDLLGSHRLVNGSSEFDYAKFVSDIQKPGIILLDELSRAPLTANNILFPCLDSRRTLPVEIADSRHERTIKVHPECTFIATANIGSEYSGTNEIDAALLNRFLPLQLDYLPAEIEIKVLVNRTGIDMFNAEKIVTFFNTVRAKYSMGDLSKSVSTREALACAEMFADGFKLIDAIEFIVANKYINNNYNNEFTMVKQIIMEF